MNYFTATKIFENDVWLRLLRNVLRASSRNNLLILFFLLVFKIFIQINL